jgi:hypothetical protein
MAKRTENSAPTNTGAVSERLRRILTEATEARERKDIERRAQRTTAVYRTAIVTFVDILGFRELVRSRDALQLFDLIQEIRSTAGQGDEPPGGDSSEINWTRVHAFSDSVVRVRTYDSDFREGALFYELLDLVHAQTELAGKGILIRGAMTAGQIYTSADLAFGPAFVRSYDLESSLANYPRIVIDPQLIRAVRRRDCRELRLEPFS